jgi:hypothetical protein
MTKVFPVRTSDKSVHRIQNNVLQLKDLFTDLYHRS